jgi:hypothetical protein
MAARLVRASDAMRGEEREHKFIIYDCHHKKSISEDSKFIYMRLCMNASFYMGFFISFNHFRNVGWLVAWLGLFNCRLCEVQTTAAAAMHA